MNPAPEKALWRLGPRRLGARLWTGLTGVTLVACGGSTDPNGNDLPPPSEACATQPVTQLAPGEHVVLDPATTAGCLRVPEAGSAGALHLVVLASTNGTRSGTGIQGTYLFRASRPSTAAAAEAGALAGGSALGARGSALGAFVLTDWRLGGKRAAEFDGTLRERERSRLSDPRYQRPSLTPPPAVTMAPPLGDVRTFKACANLQCSSFTNVTATARYVGEHAAIYYDNNATFDIPSNSDLAELGGAFDTYHYAIDTTAFGRESDIDANGVVIILMTKAVNDLTPDCEDGRVVGFFFGGDLLTGPNSNRAEVFYTLVPAPQSSSCSAVSKRLAINNLKPTLIHEFQHMISFNQHVLIRSGLSEDVWLNEALAHFAEELGGRQIPDAECTPFGFPSCRSQYISGTIINAYEYAEDTDTSYLVFPNTGTGTLPDRGAGWLFLRWVLDQFAADTILGTDLSRLLVATAATGAGNVATATGGSFPTMVPEWLMAIYLDDGTELPEEPTGRLRYKSWGLRAIWSNPQNFTRGFPLVPPTITGSFSKGGPLKAGSGQHFLVSQSSLGPPIDLQVLRNSAGTALDPQLQARFGIVRIR
ncbi:MAG: hypothetical protein ACT4PM_09155 [Gemmatimonadales bacterium]